VEFVRQSWPFYGDCRIHFSKRRSIYEAVGGYAMTDRELLQMALDALEAHADIGIKAIKQIEALRARLAQPDGITLTNMRHPEILAVDEDADVNPDSLETIEIDLPEPEPQETIAKWIKANTEHRQWYICPKCSYQAPRFRDEWVGLTDEEARELCVANVPYVIDMVRALEAKLKEKNSI
jgi:hypothetical protein